MTGKDIEKVEHLNGAEVINQGDIVIYQTENGSTKELSKINLMV